ncbi:MAG: hypothetical protein H6Q13_2175 [Bacteroidetes bacterium]|nr:hypothetical protein [Bacteroidota bacterium]
MKKTIILIKWLSISAFILSLLACIVTWLRVDVYITNDTFVGLMAGLMGICTTLFIGSQLVNHFETNKKINLIIETQQALTNELKKTKEERIINEKNMKSSIKIATGISLASMQPFTAFGCFFKALNISLETNNITLIDTSLNNLEALVDGLTERINRTEKIDACDIECIQQNYKIEELENHSFYQLIKERYTSIYENTTELIKKI